MSKWISVGEKLPEQEISVVIFPFQYDGSEDFGITGCYFEGDWYCEHGCKINVTHWQQLPEPPEAE